MAHRKGHRENLEIVGRELNIVPYLDIMVNLVMFMLINITSFISFTILNASIPQLAPNSGKAVQTLKKAQLLLMVRVTRKGYTVDPSVQGGKTLRRSVVPKVEGAFNFEGLQEVAKNLKKRFPDESRVLIISEPKVIYDDIIKTMDALREVEPGKADLFGDVTLSVL